MDMANYLANLEAQVEQEKKNQQALQQNYATAMFDSENNDNLIKWQLDIKEELSRIYRLLRKHVPKIDKQGNEYYEEPKDEDQLFNERGVNEIMNLLNWYLNKNIILSNFSEDMINKRMEQFGEDITNFIFNNYENFGLNTDDKIKHYPIVVMNILNTIEAAYFRALNGGERESLRTARTVTQTEPIGGINAPYQMQPKKRFNLLKPTSWGK